jgi:four helix bundle protein
MQKTIAPVQCYREPVAWQRAVDLVTEIYKQTQSFPDSERFGLTAQLRRAAVSVPSNIAEGQGRASTGEFRQFLGHARGSLLEIETQVVIAARLGLLREQQHASLLRQSAELGRILNGLMNSLSNRAARPSTTDH